MPAVRACHGKGELMFTSCARLGYRLLLVMAVSVLAATPVLAQQIRGEDSPLEQFRRRNTVAGQRTELLIRIQLREAQRWLNQKNVDKAVAALNKAKAIIEDDSALSDTRRETLLRVVKDRLRVAQVPPDAADDGNTEKKILADERRVAETQRVAEDRKLQQSLDDIRALQKAGKRDDARQLTKSLAKEYPNRREVRLAAQQSDILDQIASAREYRRDKARSFDRVMNSVERSSIPPEGDYVFDRQYWKERVQKRAKTNVKYSPKERAILQALNSYITVKFKNSHFQDVIDYLSTVSNQPILVDPDSLKKADIDNETTAVNLNAKNLTLRTVLRHILSEYGLTYVVKDEVIQVVSQEKAKSMLTARVYPIGDLVRGLGLGTAYGPVLGPAVDDFAAMKSVTSIIDMIQSTVDPDSWKVNGGLGTITFHAPSMSLVILNSAEVHAAMGGLGGLAP